MRKKIFVTILLLLSIAVTGLSASPFRIGIEADYNYNFITTYSSFAAYSNTGYSGFDVTVPVEYEMLPWLSVDSGVRYVMKNTHIKISYAGSTLRDFIQVRSFIEFPLSLRLSCRIDRVRLFLGGGGYLGYWVGMFNTGKEGNILGGDPVSFSGVIDMNTGGYNRFDAGYLFEGGFAYCFDAGELYLNVRYQRSLTTLDKAQKNGVNTYIDTLSAGAGFIFYI